MIWADKDGQKIKATPKEKAECPLCSSELVSKCGSIKQWHWSHKHNKDCDDWYEPESEWHINWKNEFSIEQQEVTIGSHRADIFSRGTVIELQNSPLSSDKIIEREKHYGLMIWLLNGKTLAKGLCLRNKKEIITFRWKHPPKSWGSANKQIYIDVNFLSKNAEKEYNKIKLKPDDENWGVMVKDVWEEEYGNGEVYKKSQMVMIDKSFGEFKKEYLNARTKYKNKIFYIKKLYNNIPCGGYGELITKEEFLRRFK